MNYIFGITQRCNQPCNFQNEVHIHQHEDEESDSVEIVEGEELSKKHKKTFKSKWKTRFPWAYVVKDCDGNERINHGVLNLRETLHLLRREVQLFKLVV